MPSDVDKAKCDCFISCRLWYWFAWWLREGPVGNFCCQRNNRRWPFAIDTDRAHYWRIDECCASLETDKLIVTFDEVIIYLQTDELDTIGYLASGLRSFPSQSQSHDGNLGRLITALGHFVLSAAHKSEFKQIKKKHSNARSGSDYCVKNSFHINRNRYENESVSSRHGRHRCASMWRHKWWHVSLKISKQQVHFNKWQMYESNECTLELVLLNDIRLMRVKIFWFEFICRCYNSFDHHFMEIVCALVYVTKFTAYMKNPF